MLSEAIETLQDLKAVTIQPVGWVSDPLCTGKNRNAQSHRCLATLAL